MGNNRVVVSGRIVGEVEFNHEYYGERFYKVMISINRMSGTPDVIPLLVSDRICDPYYLCGKYVCVDGEIRTYNDKAAQYNKVKVVILAEMIDELELETDDDSGTIDINEVKINGYICKMSRKRSTPYGREICDITVAVNRKYGRTDYVPCICWGKTAGYVETFSLGTQVKITGRIQSRKYNKNGMELTAYELSVQNIEKIDNNAA